MTLAPAQAPLLRWVFTPEDLQAEKSRQNAAEVDFAFCLRWHQHQFETLGPLFVQLNTPGPETAVESVEMLAALVHFRVLEVLEYFPEGQPSFQGGALQATPAKFQEGIITAFLMLKFGVLDDEPYSPSDKFPPAVPYPLEPTEADRHRLLLTRVLSLVPMSLKNEMWHAHVSFDLASFHGIVKVLRRSLRQITEASLANVLLRDLRVASLLPGGFMSPAGTDGRRGPQYVLPPFFFPRACMGIVAEYFLGYTASSDPAKFQQDAKLKFTCCRDPVGDLRNACQFWTELRRCVGVMASSMPEWGVFASEMDGAAVLLDAQKASVGI
mmetsp:Transcript_141394/g.316965  ORF Transcript_141394/g.316965 Transcript_141394/m.316965 type:complete len:326 (-) Transcript_141394:23-1000(-)